MNGLFLTLWRLICRLTGRPCWRRVARVPLDRPVERPIPPFLQAKLKLLVEKADGQLVTVEVIVDSGAPVSLFGLHDALLLGLSVPDVAVEEYYRLGHGQLVAFRMRPGSIRVRFITDLDSPLDWPVRIHEDRPFGSPLLLGLGGVIEDCRWIFDGTPRPDAPFGVFLLDVRDRR
jgi:hypothetical protein